MTHLLSLLDWLSAGLKNIGLLDFSGNTHSTSAALLVDGSTLMFSKQLLVLDSAEALL